MEHESVERPPTAEELEELEVTAANTREHNPNGYVKLKPEDALRLIARVRELEGLGDGIENLLPRLLQERALARLGAWVLSEDFLSTYSVMEDVSYKAKALGLLVVGCDPYAPGVREAVERLTSDD